MRNVQWPRGELFESVVGFSSNIETGKAEKTVNARYKSEEVCALQTGFTLAEMTVVVAIVLVVGSLSIPALSRTIDISRLKGATQTLAAAYQDARIRATQDDTSYEVLVSPPGIQPAQVCIDLDGDGTCGAAEPVTIFPARVVLSNVGVPVPLDVTQLKYPVVNTENSTMHTQQDKAAPGLAWNARGLPCQRDSAASSCSTAGWVQHLQLQRSNGDILYGAVTVSSTGRVKAWIFIPSGNGNGQWF
jgi:prepilin-type N-terminal cleavage/methylation domain-containing protein